LGFTSAASASSQAKGTVATQAAARRAARDRWMGRARSTSSSTRRRAADARAVGRGRVARRESRDALGAGPRSAATGMVRRAWMTVRLQAEARDENEARDEETREGRFDRVVRCGIGTVYSF